MSDVVVAPEASQAPDFGAMESLADWRQARGTIDAVPEVVGAADADAPPQDDLAPEPAAVRDAKGRFAPKTSNAEPVAAEPEPIEAPVEEPKPAKPRNNPEARIQQAIARQREAERRAAEFEERLRALESGRSEPEPASSPEWQRYTQMPGAPREEEFERYADFTAAMGVWVADQRIAERVAAIAAEQAGAQRRTAQTAVQAKFAETVTQATQADPSFLDRVDESVLALPTFAALRPGERPQAVHYVGEELLRADHPVALLEHFTAHPEDLQRLATLPAPGLVTREMAKLDARLGAAARGPAPEISQPSAAKPPIRPVGRGTTVPPVRDAKDINSLAEWRAVRERMK